MGCGAKAELNTSRISSSTCMTSVVSEYEDSFESLEDGFVTVQRGRRSRGQAVKAEVGKQSSAKPVKSPFQMASEIQDRTPSVITTRSPKLISRVEELGFSSTGSLNTEPFKSTTSSPRNLRARPINASDVITIKPFEVRPSIEESNTTISTEQSSNVYRKIPAGVFVVCDDFLHKNYRRAASIHEKCKACKGCEIRLKLRYAFWNYKSKHWEVIRPYPEGKVPVNVAFKECQHHTNNTPCLRTPCSFPHGKQERLMWTLEREGSKFCTITKCLLL